MKRFSLTSVTFEGEVIFSFNDDNLLMSFDQTGASLSEPQQVFLLKNLPRDLVDIEKFLKKSPTARFVELNDAVTFDTFWNRYDEKVRSSKKKALKVWNRMTRAEQIKAVSYIPRYLQHLPPGTEKKYAETYLNAELWNN